MRVLFVHGMGRSPVSGWPMLRHLRKAGFKTQSFSYFVCRQSFADIQTRLAQRIKALSVQGDYVLVGHSLGGVLIRAALSVLPFDVKQPKHLFLLGSPIQASLLAQRLRSNIVFRVFTGDCGRLLGSEERMAQIPASAVPTTAIAGVKGVSGKWSPFGEVPNDGVVSLSEVSAAWLMAPIQLPVFHTFLPSSAQVARVILERMRPTKGLPFEG